MKLAIENKNRTNRDGYENAGIGKNLIFYTKKKRKSVKSILRYPVSELKFPRLKISTR